MFVFNRHFLQEFNGSFVTKSKEDKIALNFDVNVILFQCL